MILHIPIEQAIAVVGFAFEFTEDVGVRLPEDVGQRAEAAAVRHADDDFAHATGGSRFNQGVEGGNQAFPSFEGEALLADELLLKEFLKERGLADLLEHVLSAFGVQTWAVGQLNVLANPLEPLRLGDVHVFNPNRVAVRRLQMGNDVAEFCGANAHFIARLEHRVEVCLGEVEVFERQRRGVGPTFANGVGLGEQVTSGAVPVNQVQNLELLEGSGRGGIVTIRGAAQVKTCKKKPPRAVHRFGVRLVASVEGFECAWFGVTQK